MFGQTRFMWVTGLMLLCLAWGVHAAPERIEIEAGLQSTYTHTRSFKRVAIADPAIAGINVLSSKDILITAKQAGMTEISIWHTEKNAKPDQLLRIFVSASTASQRQQLEDMDSKIEVKPAGSGLALSGWASSLDEHSLAQQMLAVKGSQLVDATNSSFDNQVQIDIKVIEVSRQNMMRAGLFLGKNQRNTTIAISPPGTLNGVRSEADSFSLSSSSGFLPLANAFNLVFGNANKGLLGTLSLLEANGFAYTLAEPSLTAISGQTATFLAGGEFPVPIRSGSGLDSTVTIRYKEYGIRLMLTPTVLEQNRIFLKVSPEVSELDFINTVQTGGVSVPGLRVRRTDTSVALGNGESFVISGLVSRNTLSNVDRLPWLGNLPIIGGFFRSTRFDREDKELLMVVTPHLVRPIAKDAQRPVLPGADVADYRPSYSELFFQPRGQVLPFTGMSR